MDLTADKVDNLAKKLASLHRTHGAIDDLVTLCQPITETSPDGQIWNVTAMMSSAIPYWKMWKGLAFMALKESDNGS